MPFALLLALLLPLAACGGGTIPGPGPGQSDLSIDVGNDGVSTGTTTDLSTPLLTVGDDAAATATRALLLFPLNTVPAGATVLSATLHLTAFDKAGSPAANLGRLRFVRFQGATGVTDMAFFASELAHDPAADILSDVEHMPVDVDVRPLLVSALSGDEALGIRIEYETPTAGPMADSVSFGSANHPDTNARPRLSLVLEN